MRTLRDPREQQINLQSVRVRTLLISTYDLGRQPFGLASAAAALEAHGVAVECLDLAKQRLDAASVARAGTVAFFLPMHTATRLAIPVIDRVRTLNPDARLCAYGLYAPLNAELLREHGVDTILGGEFEDGLVQMVQGSGGQGMALEMGSAATTNDGVPRHPVARVTFRVPARDGLPALSKYASLQRGTERYVAGYTEASRGCKHRCRHCPIVPVYDGRFRIVPLQIVLDDVRRQVAAGAGHITFGDPDFLNGPRHASDLIRAFRREFPGVTYDVTIKVEHLLAQPAMLPLLRDTGCLFVTSAVESIDDRVLTLLEKGHTRADFEKVVGLCRAARLTLVPTFVAFTPWTTLGGYCDLLQAIDTMDLVEHVSPVQLVIRLLIPRGSRLLEIGGVQALVEPYSAASLTYPWRHPDPDVDALQRRLEAMVGNRLMSDRTEMFTRVWEEAHAAAGQGSARPIDRPRLARAAIPYLNEPWYC
jgi:radical SAM superfamily enzyme YgiQ (UPF0313 family)